MTDANLPSDFTFPLYIGFKVSLYFELRI